MSKGACDRRTLAQRLRRLAGVEDAAVPLGESALLLAAYDRPDRDTAPYERHLESLAEALAAAARGLDASGPVERRAELLARVVAEDFGYQGDSETYDALANTDLMEVIERRRGLPVALGILYLETARAQGWAAQGLAFPGHFLIALEAGRRRVVLDPFAGGHSLAAPELRRLLEALEGPGAKLRPSHLATLGNRAILLRLRNNLKLRLLQGGERGAALEVLETMLMLAPGRPALWFETATLQAEAGNLGAALLALDHCRELDRDGALGRQAAELAQGLRRRLN